MVTFQIKQQQQPVDPGQFLSDKLEKYKRVCLAKVEKMFLQKLNLHRWRFFQNNFSRGCKKIPISSIDEARLTFSWTLNFSSPFRSLSWKLGVFKAYWRSLLLKRLIFGARFLKLVASKPVMEFFRIFFFALKSTLTLFCLLLFFLLTMDVWTKFESKMTHTGMQTIVCEVFRALNASLWLSELSW